MSERKPVRQRPDSRKGLAVEGPGFLVWDEVESVARRRAAELLDIVRGASARHG